MSEETKDVEQPTAADETTEATAEEVKDWEAEAAKWRELARKHETRAKANADAAKRVKEMEDAEKSELTRAQEAAQSAAERAVAAEAKALRYEVAADKQVPSRLMKFLVGTTKEELEASADELIEALKPDTGASDKGAGKPKEALRAGAAPTAEPEKSIKDVLDSIPRV